MAVYQYILTGIALLICSFTDVRSRKVYKSVIVGYFLLALLGRIVGRADLFRGLADLLPGMFCFLVSWISRQGLGYGDSALVAGCGISVGLWPCLGILSAAFLLAGLWSAVLLVFRKVGRKKEIPFIPFLLFGAVCYWIGGV